MIFLGFNTDKIGTSLTEQWLQDDSPYCYSRQRYKSIYFRPSFTPTPDVLELGYLSLLKTRLTLRISLQKSSSQDTRHHSESVSVMNVRPGLGAAVVALCWETAALPVLVTATVRVDEMSMAVATLRRSLVVFVVRDREVDLQGRSDCLVSSASPTSTSADHPISPWVSRLTQHTKRIDYPALFLSYQRQPLSVGKAFN
ncbi:hypothetical protein J6590_016892 [Homalodisca vitripennis]|nr:hypothetical protein J6590_016892 [Homalodisca vitripennis]